MQDTKHNRVPRVLLVDDDPIFGEIMQGVARTERVPLIYYQNAAEFYRDFKNLEFDVAIVDYDLGRVTGNQLSNFVLKSGKNVPVVLVSSATLTKSRPWAENVLEVVNKKNGAYGIFFSALRAFDASSSSDT